MSPFHRRQVDRKLRIRMAIFLLIALVLLGVVLRDVWLAILAAWVAAIALLAGLAIGYIMGRLVNIRWHEDEEKVVTRMDIAGGIAIGIYIVLALSRSWLLGHWFAGVALTAITFATAAGVLMGRFLGMRTNILRALDARPG